MSRSVALPFGLSSDLADENGLIRHRANRQLHPNRQRMTTGLRLSQCEAVNIGGFGQYPLPAANYSECLHPVDGVHIALLCPEGVVGAIYRHPPPAVARIEPLPKTAVPYFWRIRLALRPASAVAIKAWTDAPTVIKGGKGKTW